MLKKSIREKLKDKGIEFVKPILTIHKPLSPDGVVVIRVMVSI